MDRQEFDALFDVLQGPPEAIIQEREEFWSLIEILNGKKLRRVLEIGTEFGGTLMMWQALVKDGLFISVDFGEVEHRAPFTEDGLARTRFIKGNSHDPYIVHEAGESRPFDFLFIDGDHSYEGVKQDFENYSPFVRPGGVIAFHDTGHPPVRQLFDEIDLPNKRNIHNKLGIGVIEL